MNKEFNKEWLDWIKLNIDRGCDKDGIFKILVDEGFDPIDIEKQMNYRPGVQVDRIQNPLINNGSTASSNYSFRFINWLKTVFSNTKKTSFSGVLPKKHILIPNSKRIDSDLAEIYLLTNFLTKDECEKVTEVIKTKLRPSKISNKNELDTKFRTSRTCDLGIMGDEFIAEIDHRICKTLGISQSYSEVLQGQYYEKEEEFKSHTDYFEGKDFEEYARIEGQRTYTFMVYLNDVDEGGETEFVDLNNKITPQQGMAVIWNNLNKDGSVNPHTIHHAHPVKSGYKSIITKWFRSNGEGEMFSKSNGELLPNFTSSGFKKERLDPKLFKKILNYYKDNEHRAEIEIVEGFIQKSQDNEPASSLVNLDDYLKTEIHKNLKPILERWSNIALEPTFVYGIRVYGKDAILKEHRDREQTHVVSAIINIDQEVDNDWPLFIEDHHYRKHKIILSPGEVFFYEGARLKHGRPLPLEGQKYANIFCHFKIADK